MAGIFAWDFSPNDVVQCQVSLLSRCSRAIGEAVNIPTVNWLTACAYVCGSQVLHPSLYPTAILYVYTQYLRERTLVCIFYTGQWMSSNRRRLNPSKTEFMWCATLRRIHQIDDGSFHVMSTMSMCNHRRPSETSALWWKANYRWAHVNKIVGQCFYSLRKKDRFVVRCSLTLLSPLSQAWSAPELTQRITFKLTVYTALHGMTPSYIAEFCRPVAATHYRSRLRFATFADLVVSRNRLELGKRAFAVAGPTAWNNLPLSVRLAPSMTTFKTALKTHLFSAAFGASKRQWLAYASMIIICFCKAPLRCLHLRRFINCQYYIK